MTKEELAKKLNGSEWPLQITTDLLDGFESNLIIVHGEGNDVCKISGAITDDYYCFGGGEFLFDKIGIINSWPNEMYDDEEEAEAYFERKESAHKIKAVWHGVRNSEYCWTYETDIPHANFDIMENLYKFCRDIVFSLDDLEKGCGRVNKTIDELKKRFEEDGITLGRLRNKLVSKMMP